LPVSNRFFAHLTGEDFGLRGCRQPGPAPVTEHCRSVRNRGAAGAAYFVHRYSYGLSVRRWMIKIVLAPAGETGRPSSRVPARRYGDRLLSTVSPRRVDKDLNTGRVFLPGAQRVLHAMVVVSRKYRPHTLLCDCQKSVRQPVPAHPVSFDAGKKQNPATHGLFLMHP
jgi:hypothetical protein